MRGYKIFGPDYTCRGYTYSLNTHNIYSGEIKPCDSGFHYCPRALDCLRYYDCTPENTYAEVECGSEYIVKDDKVVCKELRIVKTLTYNEFSELVNTPLLKCSYVKGLLTGGYKKWYENGQLRSEYTYVDVDGKRHRTLKLWHKNSKLWLEATYVDDKENGTHKEWWENGQLALEFNYVDGKLHGDYKTWHKNGQLSLETAYVDDEQHGPCMEWMEDGQLSLEKSV